MMNPEFKRNLWLSFSTHRLIAMPALLGLTFLAIVLSERNSDRLADILRIASTSLFIFIVWLWGARNANSTIVDELRDKTWDQQRMSALGPWAMTWGKLFGSTSFNWYGGAFCLIVAALSGIAAQQPLWLFDLLTLIAVGVMLHASLIALNLHTGQLEMQFIQRGGFGWLAIIFVFPVFSAFINIPRRLYSWWGMEIDSQLFVLGSAVLFAACATFAAWRVVNNALQVRTRPWAWPLFAIILATYLAGFPESSGKFPLFMLSYFGLFVATSMSYAALFTEPTGLLVWNRLRLRQQARDWRGWLELLPLWPTTLLLAFVFALVSTLSQPAETRHTLPPVAFVQEPINLALMLLRDAGIVLFFSFAANAKRAIGVATLYLIVINLLLPFLFKVAGLEALSYFFFPADSQYGAATSVMVMATHAGIALSLVAWRLRSRSPN